METDQTLVSFDAIRSIVDFEAYLLQHFEEVDLKRERGGRIRMICPFHSDSNPSLVVYLNTQSFTCFGCLESGDVFDFIVKYEEISLLEVVRRYATDEHIFASWRVRLSQRTRQTDLGALYISVCLLLRRYTKQDREELCKEVDRAIQEENRTKLEELFSKLASIKMG